VRASDPELLVREYSTSERLERRRTNLTAWMRGQEAWDVALAAVAAAHPHRVLDAGCGDGLFASLIAAPEVIGLDSSAAMVERARSRGVDARLGDIHELPFDEASFDVVVCNWTLYHLADLDRGIAELARVARTGGRFVGVYNRKGHMAELWSVVRPGLDAADDYEEPLRRVFARVEVRDTESYSQWDTREDLQAYLDAYVELLGAMRAPEKPYPFRVTRRNRVYVAEKA